MNKQINHQPNGRQRWLISRLFSRNVALLSLTTILINPIAASYAQSSPILLTQTNNYLVQITSDDYYKQGIEKLQSGDYQGAIEAFNQAILLNPNNIDAYISRGIAYAALTNYQKAISDYDEALKLDPSNADAYNNRGVCRQALGDFQGAIQDFYEVIRLQPNSILPYLNVGNVFYKQGNYTAAMQNFRTAAQNSQKQGNNALLQESANRLLITMANSNPYPLQPTPTPTPQPPSQFDYQELLNKQLAFWEKKYPNKKLEFIVIRLGIRESAERSLAMAFFLSNLWKRPVLVLPVFKPPNDWSDLSEVSGRHFENITGINFSLPDNGVKVLNTIIEHGHRVTELHFFSGGVVTFDNEYKTYADFINANRDLGLEKIVCFGGSVRDETLKDFRKTTGIGIEEFPEGAKDFVYYLTDSPNPSIASGIGFVIVGTLFKSAAAKFLPGYPGHHIEIYEPKYGEQNNLTRSENQIIPPNELISSSEVLGELWKIENSIAKEATDRQDFEEGLAQSRLKALEDYNPNGLPPPPPPGAATLPRNISEAIKRGEIAVEAEGTGNPSSLRLRITNKNPDRWMQIGIPPGTTFNPGTLNTQRMTISPSR
jgi:tetratricopeptide (TPR) repeat protein